VVDRRGVVARGSSRLVSLPAREKRLRVKTDQVEEQVKELIQKVKERQIVVEQNQRAQTEDHPTSNYQLHSTQCRIRRESLP
jgi:histidinol phosphatase-like PHP family hydrolase